MDKFFKPQWLQQAAGWFPSDLGLAHVQCTVDREILVRLLLANRFFVHLISPPV